MAAVTNAGSNWVTTGGNTTVTATPSLSDLIVVVAGTSGLAGGTTNVTDNNSDGFGTTPGYKQVDADRTGFSTTGVLTIWIRNALISSATSTIFTAAQGSSTGGGLVVFRISGMSIVGLGAVRGSGGQSTGTAVTTPAPVLLGRLGTTFSGTQAALTDNVIITAVANGSNTGNVTIRSSPVYTRSVNLGYNSPATGLDAGFINSGETASTITWGGTSATTFASLAIELDTSVPQYDWVLRNQVDADRIISRDAVMHASNW